MGGLALEREPMVDEGGEGVTLNTIHEDLKAGFADLKTTLLAGFRSLPTREPAEETVRLLRESNRLQDERLVQLDARIREQHPEVQQTLRGLAEAVRGIADGIRALMASQRALHEDIARLIARLDALIRGRGDGALTP